ncbi:hypothetical protein [Rhodoblastus sp.]|jgi:hypothetical protein|uniref:hypothetical protein n=1 Tax=Rhodoblastus sp. TaxID=1962975 RepID=UPI0025CD5AE4|nr:hypothetical protein [Rhodoblastus sp.]
MKKISPKNFGGDDAHFTLKRRGRKPLSNFYQHPEIAPAFALTEDDWKNLEHVYGHNLDQAIRAEVEEIISDYFWHFLCDGTRSYSDEAITYLEKIAKDARPPQALMKKTKTPARTAARDVLLEYYLFDQDDPDTTPDPKEFLNEPDKVRIAAQEFARHIAEYDMSPPSGTASEWEKMVVAIQRRLKAAGLPHTINKRGTRRGASPIVSFLICLQEKFPNAFQSHLSRDGEPDEATIAAAASKAWIDFRKSAVGRRDARKRESADEARMQVKQKKELGRAERLNKAFKYLEFRKARQRSAPVSGTRTPKTTS